MGRRVENKLGRHRTLLKHATLVAKYTSLALSIYYTLSYLFKKKKEYNNDLNPQGASSSKEIGKRPEGNDEKENVWKKDEFTLTSFDINPLSLSWKALDFNTSLDIVSRNIVHMVTKVQTGITPSGGRTFDQCRTTAICFSGHYYLTTLHSIPMEDSFQMEILNTTRDTGTNSNVKILICQNQIHRFDDKDCAIIHIPNLPPKKNIVKLFSKIDIPAALKCCYLTREKTGDITRRDLGKVTLTHNYKHVALGTNTNTYFGKSENITKDGDCGSPLIADTFYGPVIVGIHHIGNARGHCGATAVTSGFLEAFLSGIETPQVEAGTPDLSSQSAVRELVTLNHKAPVRFFEEGYANVYGSFAGFRGKHKSMVKKTIIHDNMTERGFECEFGPPVMNGWRPWRIALKDLLKPVTQLRSDYLEQCVDSFTNDILSRLTQEDLSDIFVYDNLTAVNGAPGVKFVDSINRSTSAGNPWKCSKKKFLTAIAPIGNLTDPVAVDDEIMDRSDKIIASYHEGIRVMPNFCGHLKDEAVSEKKRKSGKTRVFAGSPFDWNIVVRKYLLALVRKMQQKKFIFECAPGTNAQSTEWAQIYSYLTQHGQDRCVAGDYAAFDKTMPPIILLGAFKIIYRICKKAGYTDDDLKVVWGIAEDTSFPLIDMNGDLIEFFGSNPSGHPLTVIINSLANSLYMRYAYLVCNPEKETTSFKENVSLMTYGDDNVLSVSPKIDFYNHTTIQTALADVGITYTMADKETESIPFLNIKDISFLKRSWRYDDEVGTFLCPLEETSIIKSLMINNVSKHIPAEEHIVNVISSAVREYFFHGREMFEQKRCMLQDIVAEKELGSWITDTTFPTYAELLKRFWDNSD